MTRLGAGMTRRPRTLAGQFLLLQLGIVVVVLLAVAAVSLDQSARSFERERGRRILAVAEYVAATPLVRDGVDRVDQVPRAEQQTLQESLTAVAAGATTFSGVTAVLLADRRGVVVASDDPSLVGRGLPGALGQPLEGRAWTGKIVVAGEDHLSARVPVLSGEEGRVGELVGFASVIQRYPSLLQRLGDAGPNLLTYLGIASLLGMLGSWLLARRVKRQTLGLEPREITELVEHRDAILHGIKEGVVALDQDSRVTLVNDVAVRLLNLPADASGRTLTELGVDGRLRGVLTGAATGTDEVVVTGDRVLVLNHRPIRTGDRLMGSVTTLRDRTELASLQRELGSTRTTTETLRAQTHEFSNQLHTISGLIEIGEHEEVVRFVAELTRRRAERDEDITSRVCDPTVAALLIAKSSLAAERGADLRLSPASTLPRVSPQLSADLTTVVGNLVDNALDALARQQGGHVDVSLAVENGTVVVTVRDDGPGVPAEHVDRVFEQGFTTKPDDPAGGRGYGLALVRVVCARRGGNVRLTHDGGAVFTARLPAVGQL